MNILFLYTDFGSSVELKYAIRSACKYHDASVYVVGDCPTWYKGPHIPFENTPGPDVTLRLMKGLEALDCEEVLVMHDDMYLLEPYEPCHYHSGTLKDRVVRMAEHRKAKFQRVLEVYPDGLNYSLHQPLIANRQELIEAIQAVPGWEKSIPYENAYGNYTDRYPQAEGQESKQYKAIYTHHLDRMPFFSTGGDPRHFKDTLFEMYPEKSIFEY